MTGMTTFDRRPPWALSAALVASLVARAGAQPAPSAGSVPPVGKSAAYGAVTVTPIADGLESPWGLAFLPDANDIFVADDYQDDSLTQTAASRLVFGPDGMLYMGVGAPNAPAYSGPYTKTQGGRAQDPSSHGGKIMRLRDDGTAPPDNPFV